MKRIRLSGVSKHYGEHFALHRVSLELGVGITGLLGANGAGKTTLLHLLATLEAPSRGELTYDAVTWERMRRFGRGQIGWVGHQPMMYLDLTGWENLTFYGQLHGVDPQSVGPWLERVGLDRAAWHKRVQGYSRGMLQRLTIARALMPGPPLLLLDEPLTGLDRQGRAQVAELLAQLRAAGTIVVVSSHDLQAIESICERLVILSQGKLVFDEPIHGRSVVSLYEELA